MRKTVLLTGVFLCAFVFMSDVQKAEALYAHKPTILNKTDILEQFSKDEKQENDDSSTEIEVRQESVVVLAETPVVAPPEPVIYTVVTGDTLTSIADKFQTTWNRVYAKNVNLINPDEISAGTQLTIPTAEEQLTDRPIAETEEAPVVSAIPAAAKPAQRAVTQVSSARGSTGGNTYARGYCTFYAKSRRSDLPNNLGNASTWVARARAQGFATGSSPRVGAIGQQGNHVVFIEAVNANGTVTVSEMNYAGLGIVSSRTVPAGSFQYIY